jgi:transcriptional regulator with XRE-family HTH domain
MNINRLLEKKKISKYRLAKDSGIPYMTINDICSGKANLAECNAKTVYKISQALNISMEELIESYVMPRPAFELFKSNVCHKLKELGDVRFLVETLENNEIVSYYDRAWYPECLYLLAMVDYVSRENNVPLCEEYNRLRQMKLKDIIYPAGLIAALTVSNNDEIKKQALKSAIPEFLRFNIVESEVRNVV